MIIIREKKSDKMEMRNMNRISAAPLEYLQLPTLSYAKFPPREIRKGKWYSFDIPLFSPFLRRCPVRAGMQLLGFVYAEASEKQKLYDIVYFAGCCRSFLPDSG